MHCLKLRHCAPQGVQDHSGGLNVELVFGVRFLGLESLGLLISQPMGRPTGMMVEPTP